MHPRQHRSPMTNIRRRVRYNITVIWHKIGVSTVYSIQETDNITHYTTEYFSRREYNDIQNISVMMHGTIAIISQTVPVNKTYYILRVTRTMYGKIGPPVRMH